VSPGPDRWENIGILELDTGTLCIQTRRDKEHLGRQQMGRSHSPLECIGNLCTALQTGNRPQGRWNMGHIHTLGESEAHRRSPYKLPRWSRSCLGRQPGSHSRTLREGTCSSHSGNQLDMSLRLHFRHSHIQVGRLGNQSWSGHQEGWQCTPFG